MSDVATPSSDSVDPSETAEDTLPEWLQARTPFDKDQPGGTFPPLASHSDSSITEPDQGEPKDPECSEDGSRIAQRPMDSRPESDESVDSSVPPPPASTAAGPASPAAWWADPGADSDAHSGSETGLKREQRDKTQAGSPSAQWWEHSIGRVGIRRREDADSPPLTRGRDASDPRSSRIRRTSRGRDRVRLLARATDSSGTHVDVALDFDPSATASDLAAAAHHAGYATRSEFSGAERAGDMLTRGESISGHRGKPPRSEFLLLATSGYTAGRSWIVHPGRMTIGGPGSDIVLDDPELVTQSYQFLVGRDGCTDFWLTGSPDANPDTTIAPNSIEKVHLGNSVLAIATSPESDASLSAPRKGQLRFSRPATAHELSRLPEELRLRDVSESRREPRKWGELAITVAATAVFIAASYFLRGSGAFAIIFAIGGFATVAQFLYRRFSDINYNREASRKEASAREQQSARLASQLAAEVAAVEERFPDPARLMQWGIRRSRHLWRQRGSRITLRVGVADQPSVTVRRLAESDDPIVVPGVPVVVDLSLTGVLSVEGIPADTQPVTRGAVMQLVARYSPRDLRVVVLSDGGWQSWSWARWLPHLRSEGALCAVGTDHGSIERLVSELADLVGRRHLFQSDEGHAVRGPTVVLVAEQASLFREVPGFVEILRRGPEVRVLTIATSPGQESPEEADASLRAHGTSAVLDTREHTFRGVLVDRCAGDLEEFARSLAPLVVDEGQDGGLPSEIRYLERVPHATDTNALSRLWGSMDEPDIRSEILATGRGLAPVDLDEIYHLVTTGTTRSGKTEFILSWLVDLAVRNPPDLVEFLVIGWKGTGDFERLRDLPHLQRLASNADQADATKAILALEAECGRREKELAEMVAGKRISAANIATAWGEQPAECRQRRLTRLVVVVDEFARMRINRPDFIPVFDSVLQQGAGLGVHLALIAQDPKDAIRGAVEANAQLRIAFRAVEARISKETINAVDAYLIDPAQKGRGYAFRQGRPLREFQGLRITGQSPADDGGAPCNVTQLTQRDWIGDPPADVVAESAQKTDLDEILAAITAASRSHSDDHVVFPGPLPRPHFDDMPIPGQIGIRQDPTELALDRRQRPLTIDPLDDGHVAVAGAEAADRAAMLEAMILGLDRCESSVEIAIVDLVGSGLGEMSALPSVGSAIGTDVWRINWLLNTVTSELQRRQRLLQTRGSLAQQLGSELPFLYLVLNGWEPLTQLSAEHSFAGKLLQCLRAGAEVGVRGIIAGEAGIGDMKVADLVSTTYVLDVPHGIRRTLLKDERGRVPEKIRPGQAFTVPGLAEVSFASTTPVREDSGGVVAKHGAVSSARPATLLVSSPMRLGLQAGDVPIDTAPPDLWIGNGGPFARPVTMRFDGRHMALLVFAPSRSTRAQVLQGIGEAAHVSGWNVVSIGTDVMKASAGDGPTQIDLNQATGDELDFAHGQENVLLIVDDGARFERHPLFNSVDRLPGSTVFVVGAPTSYLDTGLTGFLGRLREAERCLLFGPTRRSLLGLGLDADQILFDDLGSSSIGLLVDDQSVERVAVPEP